MIKKIKIHSVAFIFLLLTGNLLQAQILKDTAAFNLIRKGVAYIYNLQFNDAQYVYQKIKAAYPEHPVTYAFKGMITYWESYPMLPSSPKRFSFENDMKHAIELCEKVHSKEHEAEYTLASIAARGLLLLYYADNELNMDVISLASSTYKYVKLSFDYTDVYPDFYFVTGLYNYYREAYPEAHPVYKPLAMLFPKGDMKAGLKELQIAGRNAIFLKAESYSFLTGICISFENDFQQAYHYSKTLYELFPNNTQFLAVYIKNLLLVKRYSEAENIMKTSRTKVRNTFYQAQLSVFNGILYEKKYRDLKSAREYYLKGINDASAFGEYADEIMAYAYFGLSRISETNNDKQNQKAYRKKATELADYENVNFDE